MADYQYLTEEDKARIVAEMQASVPDPAEVQKAAEAAHFRAVIGAKYGLNSVPDPYEPPDVSEHEAAKVALETEAGKLPAVSEVVET